MFDLSGSAFYSDSLVLENCLLRQNVMFVKSTKQTPIWTPKLNDVNSSSESKERDTQYHKMNRRLEKRNEEVYISI